MGKGKHSTRALLHLDKLPFFKHWVLRQGYREMPSTGHAYEVLRIRRINPQGDEPDIFFYQKNLPTQHVTLCRMGEKLVQKFIHSQKPPKARNEDVHFEKRFHIFEQLHEGKITLPQARAQFKDLGYSDSDFDQHLDG